MRALNYSYRKGVRHFSSQTSPLEPLASLKGFLSTYWQLAENRSSAKVCKSLMQDECYRCHREPGFCGPKAARLCSIERTARPSFFASSISSIVPTGSGAMREHRSIGVMEWWRVGVEKGCNRFQKSLQKVVSGGRTFQFPHMVHE